MLVLKNEIGRKRAGTVPANRLKAPREEAKNAIRRQRKRPSGAAEKAKSD